MTAPSGSLIALVDDEENLRETVGLALRRAGYRAETYARQGRLWPAPAPRPMVDT